MSKSPAMINRAKRIPEALLKFRFRNKDYSNPIPIRPIITVKQFLSSFVEKNTRGLLNYSDLELYTHDNEIVPYDHKIVEAFYQDNYKLFYSDITPKGLAARSGLRSLDEYKIPGVSDNGTDDQGNQNFFSFLLNKFPKYKLTKEQVKEFTFVKNVFNVEAARQYIDESRAANYGNQWLYNKNTFSNVSLLNYSKWDENFYKNLLIQILNSVTVLKSDLILDLDSSVSGIEAKEKKVDILIKTKDLSTQIPLNIVEDIDEVKIYNEVRTPFYDYFFPKIHPMFVYELVNPNKSEDLTSDVISRADSVNKEGASYFRNQFQTEFFKVFDDLSFKNLDVLKTISKNRYALTKRAHIGLTAHNDKIRFNLYLRPKHRKIENLLSVHRSEIFDLGFDLNTLTINNVKQFAKFLSIFNAISNLSPIEIDTKYNEFLESSGAKKDYNEFITALSKESGENEKKEKKPLVRKFRKFKF